MGEFEKEMFEKEIKDAKRVVSEFLAQAKLKKGELVVIGCSTSEIASPQTPPRRVPHSSKNQSAAKQSHLDRKSVV